MQAPLQPLKPSPQRVAIVTSDGYEVWGVSIDPVSTAANYALVDAFTQFLEKRVFTQNMELLRRMMAEYFCHCDTTVREYVAQCSAMICVGPFDADTSDLLEAKRLLSQPRSFARSGVSASVFTFLVTRLRMARASLLMQFFIDFCQGDDTALCEFVDKGDGFVSVMPVAAPKLEPALVASSDGILFENAESVPMPSPPVVDVTTPRRRAPTDKQKIQPTGKKRRRREHGTEQDNDALTLIEGNSETGWEDEDCAHDADELDIFSLSPSFKYPSEAQLTLKTRLVRAVETFQKHEPWTKVFPPTLPLPFDEAAYPDLARHLRSFWTRYGRAVWERQFWVPLSSSDRYQGENSIRRARQRIAAAKFEEIIRLCFEQFGAKFFVKLDRKRHPGWWYRSFCVDLHGLSFVVGYDKSIEYVETQLYKRFPDCGQPLPLPSANAGVLLHKQDRSVSKSLWLDETRPSVAEMKAAYTKYAAKKEKQQRKKAAKKAEGMPSGRASRVARLEKKSVSKVDTGKRRLAQTSLAVNDEKTPSTESISATMESRDYLDEGTCDDATK
jgi:hypothetical protein